MKDHNNISRNNRETFTYYEDLNEITLKAVIEYGFEDDRLPINISPSCSGKKSTPSMPETEEELSDSSLFLGVWISWSNTRSFFIYYACS